ncbi:hypothetical protein Aduo_000679 [Ancylostoma duodenale]
MDPSNGTEVTENGAVDNQPTGRLTTVDPAKAATPTAVASTQSGPAPAISSRKSLFEDAYDSSTILIISIAILGVLFVILVLLIALCYQQREQRKKMRLAQELEAAERDEKRRKRKKRLLKRKKTPKKGSLETTPKTDQKQSPEGRKSDEGPSAELQTAAPLQPSDQPPENADDAGYEMVGKTIQ